MVLQSVRGLLLTKHLKVQSTWWVRPTNLQAVVVCTKTGSGTLFKDKVKLKSELYEQSMFIHKLIDR